MRAGLLTEEIEVLRPKVENDRGEEVITYDVAFRCKARDVSHHYSRTTEIGEIYYPTAKTIEVRIYQPITGNDQIRMNGSLYRILGVETDRAQQCKRIELTEVNE